MMKCTTCGRGPIFFGDTCSYCPTTNRDNTQSMDGFWGRFQSSPKPAKLKRRRDYDADDYDEPRSRKSGGFFSGWWPFKLLFFPIWLIWKIVRLTLRIVF